MFRSFCLLAVFVVLVYSIPVKDVSETARKLTGDALIEHVNKQGKWKAQAYEKFRGKSHKELKKYLGALKKPSKMRRNQLPTSHKKLDTVPKSFDSASNWPQCSSIISLIQDQSACGSCWAVSTSSAMSDRLCIASNGTIQRSISALDIMACCGTDCGYQCQGGWPDEAWLYFVDSGVVTGNNYTEDGGCMPYPIAPCWVDSTSEVKCPDEPEHDFKCAKKCQKSYKDENYTNDHYYGASSTSYSQQNDDVIADLITNGPLVAAFSVFEDFYSYKSGVYEYTGGAYLGGHAVRVVGYGVTDEGVPYWNVSNSWDTFWGEYNGYFRILRGNNECEFESEFSSGMADVARSLKNK